MSSPQDTVASISFEVFADAMARLASGVAVVTAQRPDGRPCGLLVSSICSYSANPPSLLVAIGKERASYPALAECTEFGVHLLGAEHRATAMTFASRIEDKFSGLDWQFHGKTPRLMNVPVFLACARRTVLPEGDHAIVIGDIVETFTRPGEPLIYFDRKLGWKLC